MVLYDSFLALDETLRAIVSVRCSCRIPSTPSFDLLVWQIGPSPPVGCTAVVAVVTKTDIIVANAGTFSSSTAQEFQALTQHYRRFPLYPRKGRARSSDVRRPQAPTCMFRI